MKIIIATSVLIILSIIGYAIDVSGFSAEVVPLEYGKAIFHERLTSTTPLPLRRQKRTIVPTGIVKCDEGYVLVEGLNKCVPKDPILLLQAPARRQRPRFPIRSTTGVSITPPPPPEALRSTIATTEFLQTTPTPVLSTMTQQLYENSEIFWASTTESNSVYFEDEDSDKVVISTKKAVGLTENTEFTTVTTSRGSKGIVYQTVPMSSSMEHPGSASAGYSIVPVTVLSTTESPISKVDRAFIQLRELRLHATSSHRNCKHPHEQQIYREKEFRDDDYD